MKITGLLIVVASAWSTCAFSQASRPLQIGIGTGWALPQGSHAKPGPLFYLEPTYNLSKKSSVGLRAEYVMMQRGTTEPYIYASPFNPSLRGAGSLTVSGQYYFADGLVFGVGSTGGDGQVKKLVGFRPFIGAGAGAFFYAPYTEVINYVGDQALSVSQHEVSGGTKFGVYPKIGFMTGRFTFSAQYNLVFGKSAEVYTSLYNGNGVAQTQTFTISNAINNNYMSFKVGFVW